MFALFVEYPSWIDPYVIDGLPIRWYAVMYLVAFFIAYLLFRYQCRHDGVIEMNASESQDFFFIAILLLLVFARLFSVLFYSDPVYYLTHPWMIFWPFRDGRFVGLPGMSYHGGVVGCVLGGYIYARRHKRSLLQLTDIVTAGIPLGYTFGRLGNFINAELYGRVTTKPWGMIFPGASPFPADEAWVQEIAGKVGLEAASGSLINLPRHPSQLYEALFEGIVLFLILFFIVRPIKKKKGLPHGFVFSFYLIGYGVFRFFIEYCRQPDSNIGYVINGGGGGNIALFESFLNISEGQIFCLLMIAAGVLLLAFVFARRGTYDSGKSGKAKKGAKGKRA